MCTGKTRYAETWDFAVSASTFLQFDIAMGCSGTLSSQYAVQLQYSVDMGLSWSAVVEPCSIVDRRECSGYGLRSDLLSAAYTNWTRVSVYLPPGAV